MSPSDCRHESMQAWCQPPEPLGVQILICRTLEVASSSNVLQAYLLSRVQVYRSIFCMWHADAQHAGWPSLGTSYQASGAP